MKPCLYVAPAALVAGLLGAAPASAEPVSLKAFHSGKCLTPGGLGVADCAGKTSLDVSPGPGGAVMIRAGASCLFSNADGRFNWYNCNPNWNDQLWQWKEADGGAEAKVREEKWRQLRNVNSGKCLYSNSDGRFGVYDCNSKWSDQFWSTGTAPAAAKEPPPAAPRDCGMGADDPGCNVPKDGQLPILGTELKAALATIKAERNELVRKDLITTLFEKEKLTARQFVAIIEGFNNELTRMDVVRELAPKVSDPKNAVGYGAKFKNGLVRKDYLEVISGGS